MQQARIVHSLPTWVTGNGKKTNAKFGGGDPNAGFTLVTERLAATMKLSHGLLSGGVIMEPLRSSLHVGLELRSERLTGAAADLINSPNAISRADLKAGIQSGALPRILMVTAPAFGFLGAERGALISKEQADVDVAETMLMEAIEVAAELKAADQGEGVVVIWPAFMSIRIDTLTPDSPLISEELIPKTEMWKQFRDRIVAMLQKSNGSVWFEIKHGDPGIDFLCTLQLGKRMCDEINKALGRPAAFFNHEWAHLLGMGESIEYGMAHAMRHKLFTGMVHVNGGQKLPVKLHDVLRRKVHPFGVPVLMDWDLRVGLGDASLREDQRRATAMMKRWSKRTGQTVFAEHDIHAFGGDPIEVGRLSITALQEMWDSAE